MCCCVFVVEMTGKCLAANMNSSEVNDLELRDRSECNFRFSEPHWIVIFCSSQCVIISRGLRRHHETGRWLQTDSSKLLRWLLAGGVSCHSTFSFKPQPQWLSCAMNGLARLWCGKTNDWLIGSAFYSYCGCGFFCRSRVQNKYVLHRELSHYWHSCLLAICVNIYTPF